MLVPAGYLAHDYSDLMIVVRSVGVVFDVGHSSGLEACLRHMPRMMAVDMTGVDAEFSRVGRSACSVSSAGKTRYDARGFNRAGDPMSHRIGRRLHRVQLQGGSERMMATAGLTTVSGDAGFRQNCGAFGRTPRSSSPPIGCALSSRSTRPAICILICASNMTGSSSPGRCPRAHRLTRAIGVWPWRSRITLSTTAISRAQSRKANMAAAP